MKYLLFVVFLISCSSLSENQVLVGSDSFSGGSYKGQQWSEDLKFKRVSWYSKAHLAYDSYISKFEPNGQFRSLITANDQAQINSCADILVTFNTSNFHRALRDSEMRELLKPQGFEVISVPGLVKNLKLHPDYTRLKLHMYRAMVFCSKGPVSMINLNLANYKDISLTL